MTSAPFSWLWTRCGRSTRAKFRGWGQTDSACECRADSDAAGFGRDWYRERGLTWLVRCVELEVLGPSGPGDTLAVSTEVVGLRRVWARRRGEVLGPDGALVAAVLTDWVMTGPGFVPVRVPAEFFEIFPPVPDGFDPARVALPPTPPEAHLRRFHVLRSEIDPMAHVNNAAYVDYLEESPASARDSSR